MNAYCNDVLGKAPIVNGMAIVTVNSLQCGLTYNITAQGMHNGSLVGPGSSHGAITTGSCPSKGTYVRTYVHAQEYLLSKCT